MTTPRTGTGAGRPADATEVKMHQGTERATGRGPMAGEAAHHPFDYPGAKPSLGGHPHGKLSSWVVAGAVVLAFIVGGSALIMHFWWLFWVCVGVVAASVPAGMAVRIMDDTVVWGATPGHNEAALPGLAREHAQERAAVSRQRGGGGAGPGREQ